MTYIIPPQDTKRHYQTNLNDVSGTLMVTKNLNLDDEATIKLSPVVVAVMTTDDDADFDDADAMFIGDGTLYVNSDEVFSGDIDHSPLSNRVSDTNSPSPSVEDDVIYFNDTMVVSDATVVKYLSAPTVWTSLTGLTSTGTSPTVLANFDAQNSLLRGRDNIVDRYNTSWTKVTTLVLPSVYKISSIVCNGTVAYIGTRHDASGEARLFLWDGNGTTASESYGVDAFEIASVKAYESSVVCLTSDGRLLRFNGGGFDQMAVLPVYTTDFDWSNDLNDYSRVANRGMIVDGSLIYIILSSEITSNIKKYDPYFLGGVWCYDPAVGLYHRYSPSYTKIRQFTSHATSNVNISTNEITITSAPITGTPFLYQCNGTPLAPLKEGRAYFTIKVGTNTIKVAESEADALAGTAIDLTSTGNNFQSFYFYTTNDYGLTYTDNRQAIAVLSDTMRDDRYAGRVAFTSNAGSKTAINTRRTVLNTPSPSLPNRGYFVTPKMYSLDLEDKYNAVHIKYDKLKNDDKILIKYKTSQRDYYPVTLDLPVGNSLDSSLATWTNTNTFTTPKDLSNVEVGDEVEIVYGVGAGLLAHVTSISETGGTYTVNLDEDFIFAVANDQFYFVVDNWTRLKTLDKNSKFTKMRLPKVGAGEFIQFKVEMRGVGTRIRELQVLNQKHLKLQ